MKKINRKSYGFVGRVEHNFWNILNKQLENEITEQYYVNSLIFYLYNNLNLNMGFLDIALK